MRADCLDKACVQIAWIDAVDVSDGFLRKSVRPNCLDRCGRVFQWFPKKKVCVQIAWIVAVDFLVVSQAKGVRANCLDRCGFPKKKACVQTAWIVAVDFSNGFLSKRRACKLPGSLRSTLLVVSQEKACVQLA